jgi:hypothetical protein
LSQRTIFEHGLHRLNSGKVAGSAMDNELVARQLAQTFKQQAEVRSEWFDGISISLALMTIQRTKTIFP